MLSIKKKRKRKTELYLKPSWVLKLTRKIIKYHGHQFSGEKREKKEKQKIREGINHIKM